MVLPQLIANGLIAGSLYALVASGFSIIYGTNRFLHFAHGAVVTAGAYTLWFSFQRLAWPFAVSALLAVAVAALTGAAAYHVIYRPLCRRRASHAIALIASLALLFFLENFFLLLFGSDVKSVGLLAVREGITIAGATVTPLQLATMGATAILLLGLSLFLRSTRAGMTMRAVADHPELARFSGINTERWQAVSFLLGSALAGAAAISIALEQNVTPFMGTTLVVKAFTGAVVGGITSVPGAVLGSYLLGLVEHLGIWFLPSAYKDAIAYGLLILFLVIRPNGILGIHKGTRL